MGKIRRRYSEDVIPGMEETTQESVSEVVENKTDDINVGEVDSTPDKIEGEPTIEGNVTFAKKHSIDKFNRVTKTIKKLMSEYPDVEKDVLDFVEENYDLGLTDKDMVDAANMVVDSMDHNPEVKRIVIDAVKSDEDEEEPEDELTEEEVKDEMSCKSKSFAKDEDFVITVGNPRDKSREVIFIGTAEECYNKLDEIDDGTGGTFVDYLPEILRRNPKMKEVKLGDRIFCHTFTDEDEVTEDTMVDPEDTESDEDILDDFAKFSKDDEKGQPEDCEDCENHEDEDSNDESLRKPVKEETDSEDFSDDKEVSDEENEKEEGNEDDEDDPEIDEFSKNVFRTFSAGFKKNSVSSVRQHELRRIMGK